MVVNTFATTDFYDEIKPDYYVIADPGFSSTKNERIKQIQINFTHDYQKTKWKMHFVFLTLQEKVFLLKQL